MTSRRVVIGVGNDYRRDDAAGLAVARGLRARLPDDVTVVELDGEPTDLMDAWAGADIAWVVDAVNSPDPAGTVHRLDLGRAGAVSTRTNSSHGLGLGEAIALGQILDRMPGRLVAIGITGRSFALGQGMSKPVQAAVREVALGVAGEVAQDVPATD